MNLRVRLQAKLSSDDHVVTESKVILLAAQQPNKSRNNLLGQGIATLFGKLADQEDDELASQRTILPIL